MKKKVHLKPPFLKKFGNKVRQERLKRNLSMESLSFRAKLDLNCIGTVERGERIPSLLTVKKIADGLKLEVRDLFKF